MDTVDVSDESHKERAAECKAKGTDAFKKNTQEGHPSTFVNCCLKSRLRRLTVTFKLVQVKGGKGYMMQSTCADSVVHANGNLFRGVDDYPTAWIYNCKHADVRRRA